MQYQGISCLKESKLILSRIVCVCYLCMMIEKIPFLHRGCAYNIILKDDLSFERLRQIIDSLTAMGAFNCEDASVFQYTIECGGSLYSVGVDGNNLMILLK